MIMYQGIDMLAKLLAGQGGIPVNAMYLEFTNVGSVPTIVPDPADGRSYYAAMDSGVGASDYLRIPFSNVPVVSSTDPSKFLANKATFFAMSTGFTVGRGGHPFSAGAGSVVYGIALVCVADINNAATDIVFSRSYDFAPMSKEMGQEISMTQPQIFSELIAPSI